MGISESNLEDAFSFLDGLLLKESWFYQTTKHHLNIIKPHSEFWCAYTWKLDLPRTDVRKSIDATATSQSPFPMKAGEGIQIKSRGDQGSMHVDSRIPQVDWLAVLIYDSYSDATSFRQYMFKMTDLCDLGAIQKEKSKGEYRIPLRLFTTPEGNLHSLRLEWGIMFDRHRSGRVKGTVDDTWEDRYRRADEVLQKGYEWKGAKFERGIKYDWAR